MISRLYFSIVLLITLSTQILAQDQINIGILDLQAHNVSEPDAISLTNRIRNELYLTDRFTIVERERIDAVLAEQGIQQSGCTTSQCIIELGQILNVQLMIAGSVDKLGRLYTIHLRMIDVATGKVVSIASADREGTIEEVALRSSGEVVADLLNEYDRGNGKSEVVYKPRKTKPASSKDYRDKKWRFGVMGGLNKSGLGITENMSDNVNDSENKNSTAMSLGISIYRKLWKTLDINFQLMLIGREEKFSGSLDDGSIFEGTATLNQLEAPLLIRWALFSGKTKNFHLFTGFGLIGEWNSDLILNVSDPSQVNYSRSLRFVSRLGFVVGAGFDYFIDPFLITLDARFSIAGTNDYTIEYSQMGVNQVLMEGHTHFRTLCFVLGIHL